MIPVRCLSCGKVVSAYYEEYQKRTADGEDPKKFLMILGSQGTVAEECS
jgi:DNA-directed RNA polymerase subunit N